MIVINGVGAVSIGGGAVAATHAAYSSSFVTSSYPVNWISSSTTVGGVAGIAGYPEVNADQYNYASATENVAIGQSFLSSGNILSEATFFARVNGSPPGNCIAALYAHTGTFGTTGLPTGPILAASNPVAASSFPGTPGGPVTFTFTGGNQYALTSGSAYVIALYYNSGSSTNHLGVEVRITGGTAAGRCYYFSGTSWFTTTRDAIGTSGPSDDMTFHVSGSTITTITYSPIVTDTYAISNRDANTTLGVEASNVRFGQCFLGNGKKLLSASISLAKTGTPTGNLFLNIYDSVGTHGVNAVPSRLPLATSNTFNVASLTASNATYGINFTGPNAVTLNTSQSYFLVAEYTEGSSGNTVSLGIDNSSPTHTGNAAQMATGSSTWVTSSADMCFILYSV